ncbi:hypothetical protein [Pararhizobium arenae]|uniref:hypothetical protein n=1 Tax=Pararhizobium arenae TaxID=1856850 RepID=UPI00094AA562|nr:hypothetical protein [Pararhizobium arenae]
MKINEATRCALIALTSLALATTSADEAFSQSRQSNNRTGDFSGERETPRLIKLSDYATSGIVADIQAVKLECEHFEPKYRADCLKQGYDLIAERIPRNSEYEPMRRIITRAARDLGRIVARNADYDAVQRPSSGNRRFKSRRRFTAVRTDRLQTVLKQAAAVVQEAETQLLRSSENSEKRALHFQRVATAIGSTKVLLRS